jgi:hypothetical protein
MGANRAREAARIEGHNHGRSSVSHALRKAWMWALGAWLVLIGLAAVFLEWNEPRRPRPGDERIAEVASPNGRLVADAYRYGATLSDFSYAVWVRKSGGTPELGHPGVGVWTSYGIEPMKLRWRSLDSVDVVVAEDPRYDRASERGARAFNRGGLHASTVWDRTLKPSP